MENNVSDVPGPHSYRVTDMKKYKINNSGYSFGNVTKEYNFKKGNYLLIFTA